MTFARYKQNTMIFIRICITTEDVAFLSPFHYYGVCLPSNSIRLFDFLLVFLDAVFVHSSIRPPGVPPRCPVPASWISCGAISTPLTSVTYTVRISSSPIWHPLLIPNVSVTAAAPMPPVHLLPSLNMRGVPSSLALSLSYVVLAAPRSSLFETHS